MTPFDAIIERTERFADDLDRERDGVAKLLAELRALRDAKHPALLLPHRPRMLKAFLRDVQKDVRRRA